MLKGQGKKRGHGRGKFNEKNPKRRGSGMTQGLGKKKKIHGYE